MIKVFLGAASRYSFLLRWAFKASLALINWEFNIILAPKVPCLHDWSSRIRVVDNTHEDGHFSGVIHHSKEERLGHVENGTGRPGDDHGGGCSSFRTFLVDLHCGLVHHT